MTRIFSRTSVLPIALLVTVLAGCGSNSSAPSAPTATPATQSTATTPAALATIAPAGTPVISSGSVAAVVNGHQVPMSKFRMLANLAARSAATQPGGANPAQITTQVMNQIVLDEVIRQYADAHHLTVTAADMHTQMVKDETQLGGHAALEARLKQFGLNDAGYQALVVPSLLGQKVENQVVPLKLSPQTVVDVRHILFMTKPQGKHTDLQAKALATQVLAKLKAGGNFAALAKQYSEDPGSANTGGEYKGVTKGKMVKEFDQAEFHDPLHTPRIIHTQFGYHIIEVLSRHVSKIASDADKSKQQTQFSTWVKNQVKAAKVKKIAKVEK